MIKGAQKQLIVVRTGGNPYFDEAYFVLRREIESQKHKKSDILKEANRILEESTLSAQAPQKKKHRRVLLWFFAGLLCGGLISLLVFLLFFWRKAKKDGSFLKNQANFHHTIDFERIL